MAFLLRADQSKLSGLLGHSLAREIAQSIARGDGKWLEATTQSLQSRRDAVQRRMEEREEFPQYWTTIEVDPHCPTAFVVRHDLDNWSIHYKNGQTLDLKLNQFVSEGRTRLTKEQAEALLDQKPQVVSDDDWMTQDVVPARAYVDECTTWHGTKWQPVHPDGEVVGKSQLELKGHWHLRCRRKDYPQKDTDPRKPTFTMNIPGLASHLADGDFIMRVQGETITWIKQ